MKKLLLLTLFMATACLSNAQTSDWLWVKSATGESIAQNTVVDAAGNVYVAGYFYSTTVTFGNITLTNDTTDGSLDMYLVKYDAAGNVLWAKSAGGAKGDYPNAIAADAAGNVYVTGSFQSSTLYFGSASLTNAMGMVDMFIVKYNSLGNVSWAKSIGGNGNDISYSLATDPTGNMYVAGYFLSTTIAFDATTLINNSAVNGSNIFLAKYDSSGTVIWAKAIGGTNRDYAFSVTVSNSGAVYLAGSFGSASVTFGSVILANSLGAGTLNFYLVKYDAVGNVIWAKSTGSDFNTFVSAAATDVHGNTSIAGFFYSSQLTFGSTTLNNDGVHDMFIVKYDSSGNALWAKNSVTNGNTYDAAYAVAADTAGNTYVTGYFSMDSIVFSPATLVNDTTTGVPDLYVVKYDANGNVVWANAEGGSSSDIGQGIAADNAGNVYVAGYYNSKTISFGSNTLTNSGDDNMFIARYGTIVNGIKSVSTNDGELSIFPNPSSGKFLIQLNSSSTNGIIEVYDVLGKQVYQSTLTNSQTTKPFIIDLSKQTAGLYFVHVKSGDNAEVEKIMIAK